MDNNSISSQLKVYKASAGSGKTFTLSAEYIACLLSETQNEKSRAHRHILAITFTNKATTEMKTRILSYLYDLKSHQREQDFIAELRKHPSLKKLSNKAIAKRANYALNSILHDYDRFNVRTIDSFLQGLLNNLAHELQIPANSSVSLDESNTIEEAIKRFLKEMNTTNVEKDLMIWLRNYIHQRTENSKSWNIDNDLIRFAQKNVLADGYQLMPSTLKDKLNDSNAINKYRGRIKQKEKIWDKEFLDHSEKMANNIRTLIGQVKNAKSSSYIETYFKKSREKLPDIPSSMHGLITGTNTLDKKKAIPNNELNAKIQDSLSQYVQLTEDYWYKKNSISLTIPQLYPLAVLNKLDQLIKRVDEEMNTVLLKRTKQIFSLMVKENDAPFLFERAGITYMHIMIDEFQDTARTQWNNLKKLLIDGISQEGHSALIVGDVKQSIYRFNGGDWKILHHIEKEMYPQQVESHVLESNYRSKPEIVEFNNAFFQTAAPIIDSYTEHNEEGITDIYKGVVQKKGKKEYGGFVRAILNIQSKDNQKKFDKNVLKNYPLLDTYEYDGNNYDNEHSLYKEIEHLIKNGAKYKEIAILVRGKKEINKILHYFNQQETNIPVISQEAFLLSASPYISLIIHLLRWMQSEKENKIANKIPLLIALRIYEEIVLKHDNYDIEKLVLEPESFLPETFNTPEKRNVLLHLPLYDLILRIIQLFKLNITEGESKEDNNVNGQQSFLFFFLDSVLSFVDTRTSSLSLFLDFWDTKLSMTPIPSTESEGITIMTIHKSKGLDFQHVLIPFTDWDINPSTKGNPDYYWWDTTSDDRYTDLFGDINTLPIAFRSTCEKSIYAKPYEHELFMQCIDSFNLLYVAFTRAKTSLTLWGYSKTPKKEIDRSKWNISDIVCITLLNGCNTEYKETDLNSFKTFDDYCTDDKSVCRREEETDGFIHILTKGDYNANFETKNIQGVISSLPFPVGKEEAEEMSFLNFQSREIFRQSSLCGEFWTFDEPFDNQLSPIERGNLFHNALSLIQDVDDVKRVVQQMDNEGLIPLTISSEEMREYLTTKITHPDVIDWFLPGKWHVYNENTILTQQYGNMSQYRPDRVMINPNRTIVVDFKFGQPDLQRHSKQVDRYMKLLCNLGYKQVEGAIWYVEHDKIISL